MFLAAVHIPLCVNSSEALSKLYDAINVLETAHPDAAFIITATSITVIYRLIARLCLLSYP